MKENLKMEVPSNMLLTPCIVTVLNFKNSFTVHLKSYFSLKLKFSHDWNWTKVSSLNVFCCLWHNCVVSSYDSWIYLVLICNINGINTKDKNKIAIKSSWLPRDNTGSSVTSDLYQLQLSSNTGKPIFYDSSSQFNIVFL